MWDDDLPGADLIARGIADLERGATSAEALLVRIGARRLESAGVELPPLAPLAEPAELALYRLLAEQGSDDAHSRYNALVRRLVSFEHALELASKHTSAG